MWKSVLCVERKKTEIHEKYLSINEVVGDVSQCPALESKDISKT